jgi:hypothetical protein
LSYDIHITRGRDWSDFSEQETACISREQWLTLINDDPELSASDRNSDNNCIMTDWNPPQGPKDYYWIQWCPTDISARHMGPEHCRKMVQIAHRFGAIVQGDDGEVYGIDGELDWNDQRTRDSTSRKPPLSWRLKRIFKR